QRSAARRSRWRRSPVRDRGCCHDRGAGAMKHRRTRLVAGSGNPAAALALGPGSATALGRGPAAAAWMVPAGIALVVIACFLPTLRNDFVLWDDDLNFTDNPSYRSLSWRQPTWMFTTVYVLHHQLHRLATHWLD